MSLVLVVDTLPHILRHTSLVFETERVHFVCNFNFARIIYMPWLLSHYTFCQCFVSYFAALGSIDPIHAAAMMNKKRGLAGRFTANLRVST